MSHDPSLYPSGVTGHVGFFDPFAGKASEIVSRAPFFAFCLALVGLWLLEGIFRIVAGGPESFLGDTYQLQINTTKRADDEDLRRDIRELRAAVGLEKRETTGDEGRRR